MSGGERELYHEDQLLRGRGTFQFSDDLLSLFAQRPGDQHGLPQPMVGGDVGFAEFLHGSVDYGSLARAFDVSYSPPELFGTARDDERVMSDLVMVNNTSNNVTDASIGGGEGRGGMTPVTPNSSVSSSSTEAVGEEDSERCKKDHQQQEELVKKEKDGEEGAEKSKKGSKTRKKGEKRLREPRFAFMTKSEVDHLEDGYRWRKYGQKAVKNSPFPRSYYRCTTQKCSVKKRVERSYQDPTIVITTYEGQHTHQSPATVRGGTHVLASASTMPSFRQNLLLPQVAPLSTTTQQMNMNPSMFLQTLHPPLQQLQLPDYGLLQDIVPSFFQDGQP